MLLPSRQASLSQRQDDDAPSPGNSSQPGRLPASLGPEVATPDPQAAFPPLGPDLSVTPQSLSGLVGVMNSGCLLLT